MAKHPKSGIAYQVIPYGRERLAYIAKILTRKLKRDIQFSPEELDAILLRVGLIAANVGAVDPTEPANTGKRTAQAPTTKQVAAVLRRHKLAATAIREKLALEGGGALMSSPEASAVGLLRQTLSKKSHLGSMTDVDSFMADLALRCTILERALGDAMSEATAVGGGKGGRPRLEWYDDLTDLAVDLCRRFGLRTRPGRNRDTNEPSGDLHLVANLLESLLPEHAQPRVAETRHKRLAAALHRAENPNEKT